MKVNSSIVQNLAIILVIMFWTEPLLCIINVVSRIYYRHAMHCWEKYISKEVFSKLLKRLV